MTARICFKLGCQISKVARLLLSSFRSILFSPKAVMGGELSVAIICELLEGNNLQVSGSQEEFKPRMCGMRACHL